ncbi:MAG: hypothetical protein H6Q16_1132 [Bacteroidetes bacterium]|nr:hypothetical protein [Bacteroidota bacterium]
MSIYIQSLSQISIQEPLCDTWFDNPIYYNERYVEVIEPNYKQYINPMSSRRMGKILKRAVTTSLETLKKGKKGNEIDAIITATGLGCVENTEKFLYSMLDNNETLLTPTYFIQSTHNTISSQIALELKCNNYNSTYVHRGISFDSALFDAYVQFILNKINNALVGAHDEMTKDMFALYDKIGYWKQGDVNKEILKQSDSIGSFSGEIASCFFLSNEKNNDSICSLDGMTILHKPTNERFEESLLSLLKENDLNLYDIDAVVVGYSGDKENDMVYTRLKSLFFEDTPFVWYKHLFGESFSMSAMGFYVGATCFKNNKIPNHLLLDTEKEIINPKHIIIYNHFQNQEHSLILLSKC